MVKKLFLTPPNVPGETQCRSLEIPSSKEWLGIFNNALLQLANQYNYEQVNETDLTPEETAAICYLAYEEWLSSGCGSNVVEAPFWDDSDGEDAPDTADPDLQPWYEDLADWAVTAFLAVSFTPGAAIEFVTTIRQIRLFFRKRDYGAIVRILWDGLEIGQIDTYSPTPDSQGFFWYAPSSSPHTLRIEHTGEYNPEATPTADGYAIEVIRGDLRQDALAFGFQTRYDADTDTVQTSADGGETWQNAPQADPRLVTLLPPKTGATAACDSAANVQTELRQEIELLGAQLALGATATTIGGHILAWLLPGFGLLAELVFGLAAALEGFGAVAIATAFSGDEWQTFLCILNCRIGADYQFSAAEIALINSDIDSEINPTAATILHLFLGLMGQGQMNYFASAGQNAGNCGDCDNCGWCIEWDFTLSPYDWVKVTGQPGTWVGGSGWNVGTGYVGGNPNNPRIQTAIKLTVPGISFQRAEMDFVWVAGQLTGSHSHIAVNNFTGLLTDVAIQNLSSPMIWTGNRTGVNEIDLQLAVAGCNGCGGAVGGSGAIQKFRIYGSGTRPSISGDNC